MINDIFKIISDAFVNIKFIFSHLSEYPIDILTLLKVIMDIMF